MIWVQRKCLWIALLLFNCSHGCFYLSKSRLCNHFHQWSLHSPDHLNRGCHMIFKKPITKKLFMYFFFSMSVCVQPCLFFLHTHLLKKNDSKNQVLRKINNQKNQRPDKLFIVGFLYADILPPSITSEIHSEIWLNLRTTMFKRGLPDIYN